MAYPIAFIPLLSNPVGWAILGGAGYLAYKAGKKAGLKNNEDIPTEGLYDKTVKGAMKTAYKTKMKVEDSLGKTKEKYSTMWDEAQNEVKSDS